MLGSTSVSNGVLLATNKRVVFFAKKLTGYDMESFPLENISSIEAGKGMMGHKFSFFASGNKVKMKWIKNGNVEKFLEYVRNNIGKNSSSKSAPKTDIPTQIRKLAELKEQGILTEEEFKSKKSELLAKM